MSPYSNVASATTTNASTAPTGSVVINNNAAYTNLTTVTLALAATDNVGVTGYYVSSSPTSPAASAVGWVTVASSPSYNGTAGYTLRTGDGSTTHHASSRAAEDTAKPA